MTIKIVATSSIEIHLDKAALAALPGVEFSHRPCVTEDEIIAAAADADVVIVVLEPYTARVIASLKSCRLICTPKMGYDNIDVAAATAAGICVSCVPGASSEEAADHTMLLLLACARKLVQLDGTVRGGGWQSIHSPEMARIWRGIAPLRGQTLGLIGFGRIPRALVPKAQGFGLRILASDPYVPAAVMAASGVTAVALEQLLRESDFVSLHCALTAENRQMLGAAEFQLMKPTAYLINTARGALLDETALYQALVSGGIAGAALDVTATEPLDMGNPLLELNNVIFTGHSAHYSDAAAENIRRRAVEDVSRVLAGQWPHGWVNPQVAANFIARWGRMIQA